MPTIHLYAEVMPGDAARIVSELAAPGPVEVRINSPGGSVAEGLAIFNALRPRKPVVYVDGIAASIASLIAMAGARIVMAENSLLMVHWPWTVAEGNASAMRKTAEMLDQFGNAMLGAYSRTGLDVQTLTAMLDAETWLDTAEALRLGFADETTTALPIAARFDLSKFRHAPKEYTMTNPNPISAAMAPPAAPPAAPSTPTEQNVPGLPPVSAATATAIQELNELVAAALEMNTSDPQAIRNASIAALRNPSPMAGIAQFRATWMANAGRSTESLAGSGQERHATAGNDFCAAASDALAIRAGVSIAKPHAGAADLRNSSIADIARACLSRAGKSHAHFSRAELIRAASQTTSDFPSLLANSLGKMLRAGFESEPASHRAWVRTSNVPDFKPQSRVVLGSMPGLDIVPEGGEYLQGAFADDRSVPFSLDTYGKIFALSRQALINDDLGAFQTILKGAGQAASRAEADLVYGLLLESSGAGQTMQDSIRLFDSAHKNVAASATALDADALSSARILLRRQVAVGGGVLNLQPRFLLVSPEDEQAAEVLLAASAQRLSQGTDQTLAAPWLANLTLVTESRLAGDAFYLLAASEQVDHFELAYLEGQSGPTVEERDEFNVDAHGYKVRHDFGGRFLDWRGIVKVPRT